MAASAKMAAPALASVKDFTASVHQDSPELDVRRTSMNVKITLGEIILFKFMILPHL